MPEVFVRLAGAFVRSKVALRFPNTGSVWKRPMPLTAPLTYIGPKNGVTSRCSGSGLATSGPAIAGVVIAFEVGAAAPGGGAAAGGGCCAQATPTAPSCPAPAPRQAAASLQPAEKCDVIGPFLANGHGPGRYSIG